jgi:biotin carboxylase
MRKILIVNPGSENKSGTLQIAKKLKLDIYVVLPAGEIDKCKWAKKYVKASKIIEVDTESSDEYVAKVLIFQSKNKIKFDGVVTFVEESILQASLVASSLDLPFIRPEAVMRGSYNKLAMRLRLKENKIEKLYFNWFRSFDELKKIVKGITYPVVIKPFNGNHSFGVVKIDNPKDLLELRSKYNKACKEIKQKLSQRFYDNQLFLLEEFVEGKLISVDGYVQGGSVKPIGIIEYELSEPPFLLPIENYIPPMDDQIIKQSAKIKRKVVEIIKALGFDNCLFHCEMKVGSKGAYVIEVGARCPGGPLSKGYERAYGVDLVKATYDIALGKKVVINEKKKKKYVAQKAVFPKRDIKVTEINTGQLLKYSFVKDYIQLSEAPLLTDKYGSFLPPLVYYCIEADSKIELKGFKEKIDKLKLYDYHIRTRDKIRPTKLGRFFFLLIDLIKFPMRVRIKFVLADKFSFF